MTNLDKDWQAQIGEKPSIHRQKAIEGNAAAKRNSWKISTYLILAFLLIIALSSITFHKEIEYYGTEAYHYVQDNSSPGGWFRFSDSSQNPSSSLFHPSSSVPHALDGSNNGGSKGAHEKPILSPQIIEHIKHLDAGIDLMQREENDVDIELSSQNMILNSANAAVSSLNSQLNATQNPLQRNNIGIQLQGAQADQANAYRRIGELRDKRASLEARIIKADREAQRLSEGH